jgi:hypothetical protein
VRVVEERGHRLGRPGPDPGDGPQLPDRRRSPGLAVELLFDAPHLAGERVDPLEEQAAPQLLGACRQVQLPEPPDAGLRPQGRVPRRGHTGTPQEGP